MEQEEKLTLEEVFRDVIKWQEETFGEGNPIGIAKHIQKEAGELLEQTELDVVAFGIGMATPPTQKEIADLFILLINYCNTQKIHVDVIPYIIRHKLQENKMRQWNKPDSDGVITHVKNGKD